MSLPAQQLEIVSGDALDNLEDCAGIVNGWLAAGAPNTKPKSAEKLIAGAAASRYAMSGGHAIGHIALVQQPGIVPVCVYGGGRTEASVTWNLPHFTLESLVVDTDLQRQGVGKLLVKTALDEIAALAGSPDIPENHGGAVVSAMACDASWPLFIGQGFKGEFGELYLSLLDVPPYSQTDIPMAQALGKSIVSRSV